MNEPRKPFARFYSDKQIAAVVHAMLDHKPPMSAAKAVRAAADGTLPGRQLPPFGKGTDDGTIIPVPEQTAYAWRKQAREARAIQANGRLAKAGKAEHAMRQVLADAWNDLETARNRRRRLKLKPAEETRAIQQEVATARAILNAERDVTGEKPSTEKPEQPKTPDPKGSEAGALAKAARHRARTEQRDETPTNGDSGPATDNSANGHASNEQDSVGHARAYVS